MIQVICNLCGKKVDKEFVYKVKIEPWFEPKLRGMVYRREIDCCEACAKAIVIENNHLWHGRVMRH
jgi:NADH:ubiquinone oxidoreductase subunit E